MILGKKKDKIKVKNDNKKSTCLRNTYGVYIGMLYIRLYNNSSIS